MKYIPIFALSFIFFCQFCDGKKFLLVGWPEEDYDDYEGNFVDDEGRVIPEGHVVDTVDIEESEEVIDDDIEDKFPTEGYRSQHRLWPPTNAELCRFITCQPIKGKKYKNLCLRMKKICKKRAASWLLAKNRT